MSSTDATGTDAGHPLTVAAVTAAAPASSSEATGTEAIHPCVVPVPVPVLDRS